MSEQKQPGEQGSPSADSGRDSRGRFTRGNKGGPGNPFNRQMARMRQVMMESVSEDDLREIVAEVVEQAKEGDLGAAKLVLSYVVGKPGSAVDPDRVDVEELELFQEQACNSEQVSKPLNAMPVGLACEMIRAALPVLAEEMREQTLDAIREEEEEERLEDEADLEEERREAEQESNGQQQGGFDTNGTAEVGQRAQLPSVEEILAFYQLLRPGVVPSVDPSGGSQSASGTDRKRRETVSRAAQSGQSGSGKQERNGKSGGS